MPFLPEQTGAVILAAGLGSRLQPITDAIPKPLVPVHGTPILHNALANLAAIGVQETTLVVGYRKDDIVASCGKNFHGMRITYVESSSYDRTGSAYSLWLAHDKLINRDIILLEGDVFFEKSVLWRLLEYEGDVAAVDVLDELTSGSAVLLTDDGLVVYYRMNQSAPHGTSASIYKTVNIFRFTADTLRRHLVPTLDNLFRHGGSKTYVEQVLSSLITEGKLKLRSVVCDDLRWFEIDNTTDLRIAERIFRQVTPSFSRRVEASRVAAGAGGL